MTPGDSFYLYSIGTVSSAGLERCLDRQRSPVRIRHGSHSAIKRQPALFFLLFPNKYINRRSRKVPVFPDLVFQEAFVRLFDPLRQVTEEYKRRNLAGRKLRNIFNLDIFSFPSRRRIVLDDRQHDFVQLGCRNTALTVFVYIFGCFQHLQNALFCQCRNKQDRKSVNGARRSRIALVKVSITFWLLSSTKSHLFTQTTKPFLFF